MSQFLRSASWDEAELRSSDTVELCDIQILGLRYDIFKYRWYIDINDIYVTGLCHANATVWHTRNSVLIIENGLFQPHKVLLLAETAYIRLFVFNCHNNWKQQVITFRSYLPLHLCQTIKTNAQLWFSSDLSNIM